MMRWLPFLVLLIAVTANIATAADRVDTSTITGKVVCGYQGWFRAEGDGSNSGWRHYSVKKKFEPGFSNIEIWPDVRELGPDERFPTAFRNADGSVAEVFSPFREPTVRRHFQWMRDAGIDGAFLQRFMTDGRDARYRGTMDEVLAHVRKSANETGRGWTLMYDLTGLKAGESVRVIEDWKQLVREKKVSRDGSDAAYFKHRGKPLIALWGLGFKDREIPYEEWSTLLSFFRDDPEFGGCSIMVGVPYFWRTLNGDCIADPKLHELIGMADIVSPWSVGRFRTPQEAAQRGEQFLTPDLAWCKEHGKDYLPVIFPGFSWSNHVKARDQEAKFDAIPRLGGQFLWSQALAAKRAGASMLYTAMFDEMDEGTAIFKTTNHPPVGESPFLADPALPTDHYLWLTGQIGRLLRGQIPAADSLPARATKSHP